MWAWDHGSSDFIQFFFYKFQRCLGCDQELVVFFVEFINILFAVEASVHDQFDFIEFQEVDVGEHVLHCFDIRDIAG